MKRSHCETNLILKFNSLIIKNLNIQTCYLKSSHYKRVSNKNKFTINGMPTQQTLLLKDQPTFQLQTRATHVVSLSSKYTVVFNHIVSNF